MVVSSGRIEQFVSTKFVVRFGDQYLERFPG